MSRAKAYYNEHDPFAAAWLRELIKAGEIAPGDVDERSIEDVRPDDLRGYTQCHFFAGIGVWSYALRRAGWPDDRPVWTGSAPCQPFSAAGKSGGFTDERHLWPALYHLIGECAPPIVFGEQVASKDGLAWLDLVQADMEGAGYALGAGDLCAAGFGAPHIRQRLWFAAERLADADSGQCDRFADGQGRECDGPQAGRLEGNGVAERGRTVGGLGDADHARLEGFWRGHPAEGGRIGAIRPVAETGEPGFLEHAAGDGWVERRAEPSGRGLAGGCGVGGLADADGGDASTERQQSGWQHGQFSEDRGTGGLADAAIARRDEAREHERGPSPLSARLAEHGGMVRPAGPTNGFWRNADWLLCRDGKWRPVEPGTLPLAHGVANRVGRLRGYGNAVNKEAAEAFIGAYLESKS